MNDAYRDALAEFAEALDELMADLEDIRDEVQDKLEERDSEEMRADIGRMDEALKLLAQAADLLDGDEE